MRREIETKASKGTEAKDNETLPNSLIEMIKITQKFIDK